jgi:choice-of-anchor C domain-containing protein
MTGVTGSFRRRCLVVVVVFAIGATWLVGSASPALAATITPNPPQVTASDGLVTVTADATFDPPTSTAEADFHLLGTSFGAATTGGEKSLSTVGFGKGGHPIIQKQFSLRPGTYVVYVTWSGSGFAYVFLHKDSPAIAFAIPESPPPLPQHFFTPGAKDSNTSAFIGAAAVAVLSCGALVIAGMFAPPAAAAMAQTLVPMCVAAAIGAAAYGIAILVDPPDSNYRIVPFATPVSLPGPGDECTVLAAPTCNNINAAAANYTAALANVASIAGAQAQAANRFTSAKQQNDAWAANLQLSASKVLAGLLVTALSDQQKAGQGLAAALRAAGVSLSVTSQSVLQTTVQDGTWTQALPASTPAQLAQFGATQQDLVQDGQQGLALATQRGMPYSDLGALLAATPNTSGYSAAYQSMTVTNIENLVVAFTNQGMLSDNNANVILMNDLQSAPAGDCAGAIRAALIADIQAYVSDARTESFLEVAAQALHAPAHCGGGTPPPANTLLSDGGYEPATGIPTVDGFQTLPIGVLGAWSITSGGVDLVGPRAAHAAEGKQFIDLNGNGQGPATITQTVPTTPGHTYLVQYSVAGNPNGPPAVKTGVVSFAGVAHPFQFDTTGHTNEDLGWRVDQFQTTVCTDHPTLTLTSTTEGDRGPNIDRVTVTDTGQAAIPCTTCPPPTTGPPPTTSPCTTCPPPTTGPPPTTSPCTTCPPPTTGPPPTTSPPSTSGRRIPSLTPSTLSAW